MTTKIKIWFDKQENRHAEAKLNEQNSKQIDIFNNFNTICLPTMANSMHDVAFTEKSCEDYAKEEGYSNTGTGLYYFLKIEKADFDLDYPLYLKTKGVKETEKYNIRLFKSEQLLLHNGKNNLQICFQFESAKGKNKNILIPAKGTRIGKIILDNNINTNLIDYEFEIQ